jgi:hypothetical protein
MTTHENGAHDGPQRALAEYEKHHPKGESHHADVGVAPPVKPASTRRVVTIVSGMGVVLLALLVSSYLPRRATSRDLEAEVANRDVMPEVQTTQVVQAATGGDLSLPGTIQPLHEGVIYARVGG